MTKPTLEEARRIVAAQDQPDSALAIEAVAVILRFEGIADPKLLVIAEQLESVVDSIREQERRA